MLATRGTPTDKPSPRIVIVGAGFSGLCLGIRLRQAGIDSFTILEKSGELGGTWRDNTYPGAACDVPSFAYCFSFEQKTDWSRKWSSQAEIRDYMEACARKYDILRHIRFDTEVTEASFDDEHGFWRIQTRNDEEIGADVLVSAVGQLNRPHVPDLPGLDDFAGPRFHSARWDHGVALGGKRIGVIGNAASAIQLIPEIAKEAGRVVIFQRSANWMLPRGDRPYGEREKRLFARFPALARVYRWWIWFQHESRFPAFRGNRFLSWAFRRAAVKNLEDNVVDPELRAKLLPDYPVGGKRILISDDYYQALGRENVDLVTDGIGRIVKEGVVTKDGRLHELDVLVLATGFRSTEFLAPMRLTGFGGRSLDEDWKDGARAYKGMAVPGFPNLFLMYGPNTNLGHNSIIFMIECQTRYILDALRTLRESGLAWVDVRRHAMEAWEERVQRELSTTVWAAPERSWYKTASGRITNNWSGSTTRYWWSTRHFDAASYHLEARRHPLPARSRSSLTAPAPRAA